MDRERGRRRERESGRENPGHLINPSENYSRIIVQLTFSFSRARQRNPPPRFLLCFSFFPLATFGSFLLSLLLFQMNTLASFSLSFFPSLSLSSAVRPSTRTSQDPPVLHNKSGCRGRRLPFVPDDLLYNGGRSKGPRPALE